MQSLKSLAVVLLTLSSSAVENRMVRREVETPSWLITSGVAEISRESPSSDGPVGVGTDTGRSVPKTKLVGSLIFDMYDAKTKQAIWRGTVSGDVPQDPATIDAAIARYIPQMFANFPSR